MCALWGVMCVLCEVALLIAHYGNYGALNDTLEPALEVLPLHVALESHLHCTDSALHGTDAALHCTDFAIWIGVSTTEYFRVPQCQFSPPV